MDDINYLWNSGTEKDWKDLLGRYLDIIREDHQQIEKEIQNIKLQDIKFLSTREFQNWLCNKFFYWQHPKEYVRNKAIKNLEEFIKHQGLEKLACYQKQIFDLDLNDISRCLSITMEVGGIGIVGATGLLAILYPDKFGTVNKDINKVLLQIKTLFEYEYLNNIKTITPKKAKIIIEIYRKKAEELNKNYGSAFWTPRKIDMVLWSFNRKQLFY